MNAFGTVMALLQKALCVKHEEARKQYEYAEITGLWQVGGKRKQAGNADKSGDRYSPTSVLDPFPDEPAAKRLAIDPKLASCCAELEAECQQVLSLLLTKEGFATMNRCSLRHLQRYIIFCSASDTDLHCLSKIIAFSLKTCVAPFLAWEARSSCCLAVTHT